MAIKELKKGTNYLPLMKSCLSTSFQGHVIFWCEKGHSNLEV